ncbi:heat shock 70 kDa protein 12A-like [Saccostrea cucullata]|uniref:heat shock 70 kDa protein 12A-like n=1 Tax=Saccostrea cuccullata TaxID=36930 RepID=UPI002ED0A01F
MLQDINGKEMSANKVYSAFIKCMVNQVKRKINKEYPGSKSSDIKWILLAPSDWTDDPKQFLAEAAKKCDQVSREREGGTIELERSKCVSVPGRLRVNVIGHVVDFNGKTEQIYALQISDCGGLRVDDEFDALLKHFFGQTLMKELKDNYQPAYIDLVRDFENKKRIAEEDIDAAASITLRIPFILNQLIAKKCEQSHAQQLENKIRRNEDKLIIDMALLVELFEPSCEQILAQIDIALKEVSDVNWLILAGRFSDSGLLQERVRRHFSDYSVFGLFEPGLVLLRGALLYGQRHPELFEGKERLDDDEF